MFNFRKTLKPLIAISLPLVFLIPQIALDNIKGDNEVHQFLLQIEPSPTPDRLAQPTLPVEPDQADLGSQDYWLHCLPCHGDRGQGLTDEFRLLYPEGDRNCWDSGCHGKRPYENGWRLPDAVPQIIGDQLLKQYSTASGLFAFIRSSMPFQDPGSLEEDAYYRLTAFLIRENALKVIDHSIDTGNAEMIRFSDTYLSNLAAATPILQLPEERQMIPTQTPQERQERPIQSPVLYIIFGTLMAVIIFFGIITVFVNDDR